MTSLKDGVIWFLRRRWWQEYYAKGGKQGDLVPHIEEASDYDGLAVVRSEGGGGRGAGPACWLASRCMNQLELHRQHVAQDVCCRWPRA